MITKEGFKMAKINLLNGENISTKNLKFDKEQFEELGLLMIRNLRPKFHYVNGEKTDIVEIDNLEELLELDSSYQDILAEGRE